MFATVEEISWSCITVKMMEGARVNYVMFVAEITTVVR